MRQWLETVADGWWSIVVPMAWQAALVGVIVLVVVRVFRRVPAPWRYGLLLVALLKFVVPPTAALPVGLLSQFTAGETAVTVDVRTVPGQPAADGPAESPVPAASVDSSPVVAAGPGLRQRLQEAGLSPEQQPGRVQPVVVPDDVPLTSAVPSASPMGSAGLSWRVWLMLAHASGCLLVLLLAVHRCRQLRRLILSSRTLDASEAGASDRSPQVVLSDAVVYPFSCGVWQRAVVLPAALMQRLSAPQFDAVLRHEMAHHQRGDLAVNWLQVLITAVWWFHPVLWLVNRVLRGVREECCDDRLLARGEVTDEVYCEALLEVARSAGHVRSPLPLTVSMADGRHPLAARLERIMDPRLHRAHCLGPLAAAALLLAALVLLPGLSEADTEASRDTITSGAEPENGQRAIEGEVRDGRGAAVAGATVLLTSRQGWSETESVGRTQTGADGRFSISVPDRDDVLSQLSLFQLIVSRDGFAVASRQVRGRYPADVQMTLLPQPEPARYRIVGTDNKPVANARVRVRMMWFQNNGIRMAADLPEDGPGEMLAGLSDAAGRTVVRGVAAADVRSVIVSAQGYGTQTFTQSGDDGVPGTLMLQSSGTVTGRVQMPEGVDPQQVTLRLATGRAERPARGEVRRFGIARVTPDRDGRFTVPELMAGRLTVRAETDPGVRAVEVLPQDLAVSAGAETRVDVPFRPAVRVTRRLVERGSAKPVSGVQVVIQGGGLERFFTTDRDGVFTAWLSPNTEYHTVFDIPHDYLHQNRDDWRTVTDSGDTALPDIQLWRAREIRGRVLNASGQPVPDARVLADWNDSEEDFGEAAVDAINARRSTTTDGQGRFRLRGVHPQALITVSALHHGVLMGPATRVAAGTESVDLQAPARKLVALSGQINDWAALKGHSVECRLYANYDAQKSQRGQIMLEQVTVSEDGAFQTGPHFPADYAYQARLKVNGMIVSASDWLIPGSDDRSVFRPMTFSPDALKSRAVVRSRPRYTMTRRIVDGAGQPIVGARVVSWYLGRRQRHQSDEDGMVRLNDVPESGAWLFVDAPGYHFFGRFEERESTDQVRLTPRDQAAPTWQPLAPLPASPELLQHGMDQYADAVRLLSEQTDVQEYRKRAAHRTLASVNPAAARELKGQPGAVDDDLVEWQAIRQMSRTDLSGALERAGRLEPDRQLRLLFALHHEMKSQTANRRLIVSRARQVLDAYGAADRSVETLAAWGGVLLDAGETESARAFFARAMKAAEQLGDSDRAPFSRGFLAWQSAPLDYQRSLQLIADVQDEYDRNRYLTNIAHRLAPVRPEPAEELLASISAGRSRDMAALKVAAAVAPRDGVRAERIATGITEPRTRAQALSAVAAGLKDPVRARDLIRRAWTILEELTDAGDRNGRSVRSALTTAIAMWPSVEQAAPELLREYVLRTLALRRGIAPGATSRALGRHGEGQTLRLADPVLACALARYDLGLARQVALDPEDETLDLPAEHAPYRIFAAMAVLDPDTAIRTVDALPGENSLQIRTKADAWQQVISTLVADGTQRWNYLIERQYHLPDPHKVD